MPRNKELGEMAHNLDMTKGYAAMAYVAGSGVPWHQLGQEVPVGADDEEWAKAAGMDWDAYATPVEFVDADGVRHVFEGRNVVHRGDNSGPLSVVSDSYNMVQPRECIEFFRDVSTSIGMPLVTAGCLRGGKNFWALAKVGDGFSLGDDDVTNFFVLIASSLDTTKATTVQGTAIRVVCENTMNMALKAGEKKGSNVYRITHNQEFDASAARDAIGLTGFSDYRTTAERLANRSVTMSELDTYLEEVFEGAGPRVRKGVKMTILTGVGQDTDAAKGTGWGLLNGVTRFIDHGGNTRSADSRIYNSLFGLGATTKAKAYSAAAALVA
jgi:phage/plasmid-like protein (TIGR03299 family)